MMKKIIALILACLILSVCFVACSDNTPNSDIGSESNTSSPADESNSESEPESESESESVTVQTPNSNWTNRY